MCLPKQRCWDHCSCAPLRIVPIKDVKSFLSLSAKAEIFNYSNFVDNAVLASPSLTPMFPTWFCFFDQIKSSNKCYWLLSMARSQIHKSLCETTTKKGRIATVNNVGRAPAIPVYLSLYLHCPNITAFLFFAPFLPSQKLWWLPETMIWCNRHSWDGFELHQPST